MEFEDYSQIDGNVHCREENLTDEQIIEKHSKQQAIHEEGDEDEDVAPIILSHQDALKSVEQLRVSLQANGYEDLENIDVMERTAHQFAALAPKKQTKLTEFFAKTGE